MATKPKTNAKPKAAPVAAVKSAPAVEHVEIAATLKRKEFVERVATNSGLKPNAIKSVLDAVLQEMGDALSNDEELNLQPFGKIAAKRRRKLDGAEVMICKLRRNKPKADDSIVGDTAAD